MNTTTNNATAAATTEAAAVEANTVAITVKDGDIVTAKVAKIKNHPQPGVLVVIEGNPMAFLPNGCIAGKNNEEKAARRAQLIANPGTEIQVSIMGAPTVELVKGKMVGRIKVSEQRAVIAAEKTARAAKAAERNAAIEAAVASLVPGSVVVGNVKGVASKDSDRNPGEKYVYGAFVQVAPGVTGLLHMKEIAGGRRALDAMVEAGQVEVEILSAKVENGEPRVQLSQKSVGARAFFDQYPEGSTVKGKIVKTGEVVDNLHGRVIELSSGDKVFLADDDAHVKSESALARGNSTRVVITTDIVGGMVRVHRRGL
ncbi:MAG: hypothetical protein JSS83_10800 [Cyanobacteria bacterium SZAS LIN-3]|nr:hypothetical protein [Cyanobacteria bacterium SZAS LIN-3]